MTDSERSFLCRLPHARYVLFLGVFVLTLWPLSQAMPHLEAIIAAFDLGVIAFVLSCVSLWRDGSASVMRRQAKRDDVGQVGLERGVVERDGHVRRDESARQMVPGPLAAA